MSHSENENNETGQGLVYQIRLQGHLDSQWEEWFGDAAVSREENGETLVTCRVADQPALYGLLRKVRDLGLPLLSVERKS